MIIAISGFAGSGKDTVGEMIKSMTSEYNWQIKRWADKLKQTASLLTGIDVSKFEDQEFKRTYLGEEWSTPSHYDEFGMPIVGHRMTVRDMLQKLGTEAMRNGLHPNVWVNALMSDYVGVKPNLNVCGYFFSSFDQYPTVYPNWIITDTRFMNEVNAVKTKGGIVVRVNRPGVGPLNDHPSETELMNYDGFDHVIENNNDLFNLKLRVKDMLVETSSAQSYKFDMFESI